MTTQPKHWVALHLISFDFLLKANTWLYADARVDHVDKSSVEMSIDRPRASLAYSFGTSSRPEKWACPILVVNEETFRESLSNTSACLDKHRLVSRVLVLFNWTRYQSAVEDPIWLQFVFLPPLLLSFFNCSAVKELSKRYVFVINIAVNSIDQSNVACQQLWTSDLHLSRLVVVLRSLAKVWPSVDWFQ